MGGINNKTNNYTKAGRLAGHCIQRRRLLIVEDEQPLLNLLRDTFHSEHFEVLTARNGREGLDLAFKERPDLIILDILMSEMDGMEVLRRLRQDRYKWGTYVPVMILSNLSNSETIAEGARQSADYLVKAEWTLEELVRRVKEKLNGIPSRGR